MPIAEIPACSGLHTNVNQLDGLPAGALALANDVCIRKPGVIQRRPGILPLTAEGDRYFLSIYNQFLVSPNNDGTKIYTGAVENNGAMTALTTSGPELPKDDGSSYFFRWSNSSNKNFYYLTKKGPYKISYSIPISGANYIPATSAPVRSGVPRALDVQAALTGGAPGFGPLDDNSAVAYQIVFGYKDQVGNLNLGSPSEIATVSNNSGGAREVSVTFSLPRNLTTDFFYQIYRSDQVTPYTATPGVNYQLSYQAQLTAGNISDGYITVTDLYPDAYRGAFLYTDETQEGALQTNDMPPVCSDIVEWNSMAFYLNPTLPYSVEVNLSAVGGPHLQVDDVFYIHKGVNNYDYTAKASQNDAAHQFLLYTSGTGDQNVIQTAKNLVECINRDTRAVGVHARFVGGAGTSIGQIYLEDDDGDLTVFTVSCTRSGAFYPDISTAISAESENLRNAIYVSKVGLPECVPLTNVIYVGNGGAQVLRALGLIDALYILTTNGIYRVTGSTPSTLDITILYPDTSVRVLNHSANYAATLDGKIYALTSQGVLEIDSGGKTNISIPIDDILNASTVSMSYKAVANQRGKEFVLMTSAGEFVYNYITRTWVLWSAQNDYVPTDGVYDPITGNMYYMGSTGILGYESFSYFVDGTYSRTATSTSGATILVNSSANVATGDILTDGTDVTVVTNVPDGTHITVSPSVSWTSKTFWVCKKYTSKSRYVPTHGGAVGTLKRFSDIELFVKSAASISFGTSGDLYASETVTIATPTLATLAPFRLFTPVENARGHWLNLSVATSDYNHDFEVHGAAIRYEDISTRQT